MEVTMSGFAPVTKDIMVSVSTPTPIWDLHMLKLDEIKAQPANFQQTKLKATPTATPATQAGTPSSSFVHLEPSELSLRAAAGFLINLTANNTAAPSFNLSHSFRNHRPVPLSSVS